ncbi:hypothetical protein ElyMa_000122600 [Elysia marginata]|uniref:Uncharacterized protein n=1 Tax=Elysia marginata TaxID=1093978 RepID=A0AAV4EN84_9GAST|nr:hypothetical protein ElyMa_000122600 [Elysia marginata]
MASLKGKTGSSQSMTSRLMAMTKNIPDDHHTGKAAAANFVNTVMNWTPGFLKRKETDENLDEEVGQAEKDAVQKLTKSISSVLTMKALSRAASTISQKSQKGLNVEASNPRRLSKDESAQKASGLSLSTSTSGPNSIGNTNINCNDLDNAESGDVSKGPDHNDQCREMQSTVGETSAAPRSLHQGTSLELRESIAAQRQYGYVNMLSEDSQLDGRHPQEDTDNLTSSPIPGSPNCSCSLGSYTCDASAEDTTLSAGNPKLKLRRKTKGALSSKKAQYSSGTAYDKEVLEATGDTSSEAQYTPTLGALNELNYKVTHNALNSRATHNEMDFRTTLKRPRFMKNKDLRRFVGILSQNAKLNPWNIIGEEDNLYQRSNTVQRPGFSNTKPQNRPTSVSSLLAANKDDTSNGITSFRDYYFRPVLKLENARRQVRTASPPTTEWQFLRKSRYLEKMVRDYDLSEFVFPHREPKINVSSSFTSNSDTRAESIEFLAKDKRTALQIADETSTFILGNSCNIEPSRTTLESGKTTCKNLTTTKNTKKDSEFPYQSQTSFWSDKFQRGPTKRSVLPRISVHKGVTETYKRTRSWLSRLCLQFHDPQSLSDLASASSDKTQFCIASTPDNASCLSSYSSNYSDRQDKSSTGTDILLPQKDVNETTRHKLSLFERKCPGPKASFLGFTLGKVSEMTLNNPLTHSRMPAFLKDSKVMKSSNLGNSKAKGTLATMRRKASALFTQFMVRNTTQEIATDSEVSNGSNADTMSNLQLSSVSVVNEYHQHRGICLTDLFRRRRKDKLKVDVNRSAKELSTSSSSSSSSYLSSPSESLSGIYTSVDPRPRNQTNTLKVPGGAKETASPSKGSDGKSPQSGLEARSSPSDKASKQSAHDVKTKTSQLDGKDSKNLKKQGSQLANKDSKNLKKQGSQLANKDSKNLKKQGSQLTNKDSKYLKKQESSGCLQCIRKWVDEHVFGYRSYCYRTFHFILDLIKTTWSMKVHLIRMPVVIATVCAIILCTGWVIANGYYYSFQQGLDYLMLVAGALFIDLVILEPLAFIQASAISTYIWETPAIINECLRRFASKRLFDE